MVVHAALIHVVERQEGEHAAVGRHGVDLLVGDEIATDVAVRQHDAFGLAGGAGGIDKGHPVVGLDGVLEVGDDGAVLLTACNTGLENLQGAVIAFHWGQCVNLGLGLHLLDCGKYPLQEHVVAHQYKLGLAMCEDMVVVIGREGGVHRHMYHAGDGKGHVDKVPFGTVG